MKLTTILWSCLCCFSLFASFACAADGKKPEAGPNIYLPYAKSRDHLVVGVDISGYHMRYDLAKRANIFMVLLPDNFKNLDDAPVYFSIDTFALSNYTIKQTLENDLKTMKRESPDLNVVKKMGGSLIPKAGECYGAELAYPENERQFPYEIFYFCKSRSKKYSIMMSMGAKTKADLYQHLPNFLVWADAPQIVKDADIIVK
jgi:hypothetical protein